MIFFLRCSCTFNIKGFVNMSASCSSVDTLNIINRPFLRNYLDKKETLLPIEKNLSIANPKMIFFLNL